MTTIRFYRALMWLGTHWLVRLPFSDRWGFNLGNDLDEWALMRMARYLDRAHKLAHLTPVQVTAAPLRGPKWTTSWPIANISTATTYAKTFVMVPGQGHPAGGDTS
jgi:hypothetical protein